MNYSFISIEGNIGSGKTSFSKKLAKRFNSRLILESFSDNPFLPKFYDNPKRYAFPLELFFMAERYQQLGDFQDGDLFSNHVVSDYFFIKSKLFAQNNLKEDELLLFNRLSEIALKSLPKPNIVLYLHSNIERLQQNIKKRGREYELNISSDYLINIQNRYFDYLKKQSDFPVLMFDVSKIDFVSDDKSFNTIVSFLDKKYSIGIHRIQL